MIKQGTPPGHSQPLLKYTERGQDRGIGADKQKNKTNRMEQYLSLPEKSIALPHRRRRLLYLTISPCGPAPTTDYG